MNKQLVRGPDGTQMVMLPEQEYDELVAAAEDLQDLIASAEFDRRLALGRVWREYRELSLTDLASEAKLLDEELAEIETDQQSPTVEQLKAIAGALKVSMDDLVR